jgi:diaminopimelate epimerase
MHFTKMHGIGNDYIYVDCITQPPPRDPVSLAKKVSDRHFGIGGDGLILICPSERADARMRMFNADGSEAEMCGNGIRCVAKYVYDHGLARKPRLTIETGRGVLTLDLEINDGTVERVTVDMGEPILEAATVPTTLPGPRVVDVAVDWAAVLESGVRGQGSEVRGQGSGVGGQRLGVGALSTQYSVLGTQYSGVTAVSMGNPHAVLYCDGVAQVPLEQLGPKLEHWDQFPKRTNVHFVQVHSPSEVTMRTWERGSGITLACGTGACAVCVAGVLTGRTERRIIAHLPGGDLELHWNEADNHVYKTGPATEVFHGEWPDA